MAPKHARGGWGPPQPCGGRGFAGKLFVRLSVGGRCDDAVDASADSRFSGAIIRCYGEFEWPEICRRLEALQERCIENSIMLSAASFVLEVLLAQPMARMSPGAAQGFADDLASPFRQVWGAEGSGLTEEDLRNAQSRINAHVDQFAARALDRATQIRGAI